MEKELSRVLQAIKEKTGILIQSISENGEYYASTMAEFEPNLENAFAQSGELIQTDGKTYFKFNFGGNLFYAVIVGDTSVEKRYANLIAGLIESSENKSKQLSFDEQLSLIVTGSSTKSRTIQFMNEYSLPKTPLYVMTIKAERGDVYEIQEFLSSYFGGVGASAQVSNDTCAYVRFVEPTDTVDLLTPVRQAEILKRSVFEELGAVVSVYVGSTVKSFVDVSLSYNQAVATEKASANLDFDGVFAYKDYLINKIAEELPPEKVEEYLNVLSFCGTEILKDQELLNTGDYFLRNNLNVSETAREMFIHRNTLIYRLEKIEKLTGLDIKKFGDALNFKLLYIISKIIEL
ncbi:MAG: helix-turn-helix domain-containing protein [Clostridia bacterium]|nr:helix-turn-helix domain-containing protein [Clostridia bacterium]